MPGKSRQQQGLQLQRAARAHRVWATLVAVVVLGCVGWMIRTDAQKPSAPVALSISSLEGEAALPRLTTSTGDLSWPVQKKVWAEWLANMKKVVQKTGNKEDQAVLSYVEQYGTQIDTAKGKPNKLDGTKRFHILVLPLNPSTPWEAEISGPMIFAQYLEDMGALIVRDQALPGLVRGTIGLHEGQHAVHYRGGRQINSALDHFKEEVEVYQEQVRQIRTCYSPGYEPFRRALIKRIKDRVTQRVRAAHGQYELFEAQMPDIQQLWVFVDDPSELETGFGLPPNSSKSDVLCCMNFAYIDAAFAVLDQNFPNPEQGRLMKASLLQYLTEQMGP